MSAREEILGRVRSALSTVEPSTAPVGREYASSAGVADLVSLFGERVSDYRAVVRRVPEAALPAAIATSLADVGAGAVVAPVDLPNAWLSDVDGVRVRLDEPVLGVAELDGMDAVLTGCAVAIAETGTIVLDAGAAQGRRVLTLVPDVHVCVVGAAQIVGTVPEAVAALDGGRPLTWISGPSATSDIELQRVEGVHGPRTLIVLMVD